MMKHYPIRLMLLPLDTIYVVATVRDTQWAIPASAVLDRAVAYYTREKWDDDLPKSKQPKGRELRGILTANNDYRQWALEERWSEFADVAKLIGGDPDEIPPNNDRLWWFTEAGGRVEVRTTMRAQRPDRVILLWADSKAAFAGKALVAPADHDTHERRRDAGKD